MGKSRNDWHRRGFDEDEEPDDHFEKRQREESRRRKQQQRAKAYEVERDEVENNHG